MVFSRRAKRSDLNFRAQYESKIQTSQVFSANCFSKSLQSRKIEGFYLPTPSMDFYVMGFILKLIPSSLIGNSLMTWVRSVTENPGEKEEVPTQVLFTELGSALNKKGFDASSFSSDSLATERIQIMKCSHIEDEGMSFKMNPIT